MASRILKALRTLLRRRDVEGQLDEEIRFHLDMETQSWERFATAVGRILEATS